MCQKSEKNYQPFLRKMLNWRMDWRANGQTGNNDFIGPSIGRGSNYLTLYFPKFISTHQKPVYSINFFVRIQPILESCNQSGRTNLWACPSQYFSIVSICKNQAFSSFCSEDTIDLKIFWSDWPRAFWPISKEWEFSQIWDLSNHTAININFHYRLN